MPENMKANANFDFNDNDEFNRFIAFVKVHGTQRRYSKGESLNLDKGFVGFVLEGSVGVYYKTNGKFIEHAFYGMPVMEHNQITAAHPFFYRAEREAVITILSVESIFKESNVSHSNHGVFFVSLLHSIFEKLATVYEVRHGGNGYQVIKELIELYYHEPHATQGLANYILKRTELSNSYVFRVLAALKKKQYIEIRNARLTKILKPLPDKISG
ncbi:helix-turn-helix domain-containing protein [Klebsiella aerogenes]